MNSDSHGPQVARMHVPALVAALEELAGDLRDLDGPDGLLEAWARRIDGDAHLLRRAHAEDDADGLLWAVGCTEGRVTTVSAWLAAYGHDDVPGTARAASEILTTITDGFLREV